MIKYLLGWWGAWMPPLVARSTANLSDYWIFLDLRVLFWILLSSCASTTPTNAFSSCMWIMCSRGNNRNSLRMAYNPTYLFCSSQITNKSSNCWMGRCLCLVCWMRNVCWRMVMMNPSWGRPRSPTKNIPTFKHHCRREPSWSTTLNPRWCIKPPILYKRTAMKPTKNWRMLWLFPPTPLSPPSSPNLSPNNLRRWVLTLGRKWLNSCRSWVCVRSISYVASNPTKSSSGIISFGPTCSNKSNTWVCWIPSTSESRPTRTGLNTLSFISSFVRWRRPSRDRMDPSSRWYSSSWISGS